MQITGQPVVVVPFLEEYRQGVAQLVGCAPREIAFINTLYTLERVPNDKEDLYRYVKCEHREFALNIHFTDGVRALGNFSVLQSGNPLSHWNMTSMPGCCAYLMSKEMRVYVGCGTGLGTLLMHMKRTLASAYGYAALASTDVQSNTPQMRIYERFCGGPRPASNTVRNPRTTNTVGLYVIDACVESPRALIEELLVKRVHPHAK